MYKSVMEVRRPSTTRHFISIIALSIFCILASSNISVAQQVGVQTSLLVPGKTQLVKQLESLLYDKDFCVIPNRILNASDFGAVGDSKTLNTKAIQRTIDSAAAAGGGQVTFNPGIYVTGALFVKTNVDFHIPKGVTIQAIQHDADFPDTLTRIAGITMKWPAALINVYREQNVRISGKGILDGNGSILHSSGRVKIELISEEGIIKKDTGEISHQLHCIKRIS